MRQAVGRALGERRNEFILQGHLCTVWEDGQYLRTREPEKLAPAFEQQLRELGTDYLDVGMIHYVDAMDDLKEVMEGPVMAFARRLKAEGRIRCIGMSSHNPQVAIEAVKSDLIDVLMFSINPCYDMQPASEDVEELWAEKNYAHALQNIDPQRERLYELCEQRGVGINVMKVYGGGDLLNEKNSPFGRAFTAVQCLEYALSRPGVASIMTGIRSQEELQQALAWCNATAEERDYTQVMQGMTLFSWKGHCMYCGHCAPCSAGIDIAMVNKLYNLTEAEGMVPETVREHYKALNVHASDCIGCGLCEPRCPFGVEIIQSMEKAAGRFGY
jgi:predicted aldo/keto reductase-like oxidoreductase